jgi:predicted hydrocarbon binding protein
MKELREKRRRLQNVMNLPPALSSGIEELLGRSANSMTFVAGRKLGKQLTKDAGKTDDLLEALEITRSVLKENKCYWKFEAFKRSSEERAVEEKDDGSIELKLVFRDCMIRQCLFRFGHPQKGSLCFMMYGFFSGALEAIMDRKSSLEILHTGENACLKKLTISAKAAIA